jgi:hypothetical protein
MPATHVIRGDSWSITLPDGWGTPETTENGTIYIDADDRSKGIYLTTWTLGPDDESGTPDAVAESFASKDAKALEEMDGYGWRCVEDHVQGAQDPGVVFLDHLADANQYRVATKVIARPPVVVRAAFHDYMCEDYDASREYFAPIIASLRLAF